LADAYGPVPTAVATLLDLAEIRVRAAGAGIDSIIRMDPDIIFTVRDFAAAGKVFQNAPGSVRLPDDHTAHWRPTAKVAEPAALVRQLLKQLSQT
jgi:transcription-repair coupling factor (superfamily II helicase)